ncbi:MAG: aminotransferase class III-fold pyridoxal phosphate-dependent enzyme [Bacteroidota bacterium]
MDAILKAYGLESCSVKQLAGYDSKNFKISRSDEESLVLKQYPSSEKAFVEAEIDCIAFLQKRLSYDLPGALEGFDMHMQSDGSISRIIPFISGEFLSERIHNLELIGNFGRFVGKLLKSFQGYRNAVIEARTIHWDLKHCLLNRPKLSCIKDSIQTNCVDFYLDRFEHEVLPQFQELRWSVIHNDLNDNNVLCRDNDIKGIIDFGDMVYAPLINEVAIALTYLLFDKEEILEVAATFCKACNEQFPLKEKELLLLYDLIAARLSVSVLNSAEAKEKNADSEYILISEKPAWDLLFKWLKLNRLRFTDAVLEACGFDKISSHSKDIHRLRKENFSENLSLSYKEPIHMESAAFQYMYDAQGNTYLDAYNNIPHVGHCHPRISRAIASQSRKLNTNTRYHFDLLGGYSELLLSYFPNYLNKLFMVNSGSAASDLAVKLAMKYKGSKDVLVLKHGYHGNSQLGVDISSYKFDGKGGKGRQENIHVLPLPKEFNGRSGEDYAKEAKQIIEALIDRGIRPACFIFESISGCGGQVPLAKDYLKILVPFLKQKEILCISDEVQVGFGRLGSHFWGFEMHGTEPDLVILGKPIGNGHPMAAVLCTASVAERVAHSESMEFFSSFGGNPVSCAVGTEVLKIIEEEKLQENARKVGDIWKNELLKIQSRFPSIGDVRGQGLFIGIEMVKEDGISPDTELAQLLKNQMKERFILCSTDGPFDNIIKCKPPLCFTAENALTFCRNFEALLKEGV